jgi:glycine/D-amino acid oxidase-like deaminating enzyme/nitrite reductase/ring-hydroxylating ferredoxin subunit
MKRDGARMSSWQEAMPDYIPRHLQPPADTIFDVIVVGGGMTGISTALELKRKGLSVLVAEARNIGFGTTGGTTAHINTLLEAPFHQIEKDFGEKNARLVAKATREALELIRMNVEELGIDCGYRELAGFTYAQNEEQVEELEKIIASCQKYGLNASSNNTIPVNIPFTKAMLLERQAQFHPVKYLYALAAEFEKLGGIILDNCRVTDVENNSVLEIKTTAGNFRASNLFYATHIPPGVNLLHFRSAPYRSYAITVKLRNENDNPEGLVYDLQDPYHYFRTFSLKGDTYMIVGGEDHKTGHDENTEIHFSKLLAYIRSYYDVEELVHQWSSQYFNSADGLAYIGHLPGQPQNIFVATGFGGNGMPYSHIAAILLRDLIAAGDSEYRPVFDPNRIKPVAGFQEFTKEAADVVGLLFKTILPQEKLSVLADMARGEGRIVSYEGEKLAIYKDENGRIHALHPSCPHIKCTVAWNAAEKTWDCPCHGSRFHFNGEVLNAPARKGLEKVKVGEEKPQ